VWKLDRLARSMKQLIETIETLRVRGHRVSQLNRGPRHDGRARAARFSHIWRVGGIRALPDPRAYPSGPCRCSARRPNGGPSTKVDRGRPSSENLTLGTYAGGRLGVETRPFAPGC
jgi:hypothetical protein